MPEHNFTLTGDEARILMAAMSTSAVNMPMSMVINLWNNLNQISHVQPAAVAEEQPQSNG